MLATTIDKRKIAVFDEMIKSVTKSNKLTAFLQQYNIDFEDRSIYEDDYIDLKFKCNDKNVEFTTIYDALYNYTSIVVQTYCYKLVFCVMHFENEMCFGNKWLEYDDFTIEDVHSRKEGTLFVVKPLTENNIRNCLIDALRKTILCDTWKM